MDISEDVTSEISLDSASNVQSYMYAMSNVNNAAPVQVNDNASNNEVPRSAPASVVTTGCLPQWKPRTPKLLYLAKRSPLLHRIPMSVANPGTHCDRSRSNVVHIQ